MATITITPGNSFTATETVTSTKLNDLGSPTAALTAASIGTADIADDAITSALIADDAVTTPAILDANVTFAKLTDVIDDDTMATATDTTLATSESIKAYVDSITYTPNIVQAVKTDTFVQLNPNDQWFDIPDLSLSITPTSSSSKVLISADVSSTSNTPSFSVRFRFVRDNVPIALADTDGSTQQTSFMGTYNSAYAPSPAGMSYLDSTAVVAGTPVVYKLQCSNYSNVSIYINQGTNSSTEFTSSSRAISTLIATEIPQ